MAFVECTPCHTDCKRELIKVDYAWSNMVDGKTTTHCVECCKCGWFDDDDEEKKEEERISPSSSSPPIPSNDIVTLVEFDNSSTLTITVPYDDIVRMRMILHGKPLDEIEKFTNDLATNLFKLILA